MQETTLPVLRIEEVTFVGKTISNSQKVLRAKFLGSDGLFCFSSICKFGSFKNPFATIAACLNFALDSEDLFCFEQAKKEISMNYDSSTSCWKPWRWVRFHLILTMRNIYIISNQKPLRKLTSSIRSTEFKDILPWDISQMIIKNIPISMRIIISHAMKRDILF